MLELTDEQREIQALCREFAAREIRPISLAVDEAALAGFVDSVRDILERHRHTAIL